MYLMKKQRVRVPTDTNIKGDSRAWIAKIVALAFAVSLVFAFISTGVLPKLALWAEILLLFIFIAIGIIFDIIGTAVQASSQTPFHSMNTRKVKGSDKALWLIRNAEKVSSFCNDVIGDVCNIISGAATTLILATYIGHGSKYSLILMLLFTGLVSSFIITCKALGKTIALKHSNQIVYQVALLLCVFKKEGKS